MELGRCGQMKTLLERLSSRPSDPAISLPDGTIVTRGDIVATAAALSDIVDRLGLGRGHRIAVVIDDCWQYPLLTLVLADVCSVLPLNPGLMPRELVQIAQDAQVSAVLGWRGDAVVERLAADVGCGLIALDMDAGIAARGSVDAPRAGRDAGLVLLTSGTTGSPKRVPITLDAMGRSAQAIAQTLALGPADRATHALPMFHIGAVVDLFLAPLLSGGNIALTNGQTADDLHNAVVRQHATWMQLVPTMLAHCMSTLPAADKALWGTQLRFIRSVSSDLPPVRHQEAEAEFGDLPIIQMYGMTETAGQICSNPIPPQDRRFGTVGRAAGPDVIVMDTVGSPVPTGQDGEVCVRGATVMRGYEGVTRGDIFWGYWFRTSDVGRLDQDGYLTLTGRIKEMINRGGEKISPRQIETIVLDLPQIAEAVAFGKDHATLGETVGLCVVPKSGVIISEADILQHLNARLAAHKCPRTVDIREALPRLGSGKIDRLAVSGKRVTGDGQRLDDPLRDTVGSLWAQILGGPNPPDDTDDFFDVGGDSLQATMFLLDLETALGREIPVNVLYEAPRFGALVDALRQPEPSARGAREPAFLTFVRKQTAGWKGARVGPRGLIVGQRLFARKPAVILITQGETAPFLDILDKDRPVYLLRTLRRFFGKSDRMTRELAQIYVEEIRTVLPDGPIQFVGFCEGAKLAHFMAEILRELGQPTAMFISVDYPWPRPWDGPVLHVQSDSYALFRNPQLGIKHLTTGGTDVVALTGEHSAALAGPSMPDLGRRIEALLSKAEVLPPNPSPQDLTQRRTLYDAHLRPRCPRVLSRGQVVDFDVEITNRSAQDWGPSLTSGIAVCADLYNLDGYLKVSAAGYAELTATVRSGASTIVKMSMKIPDQALPMRARFAMTDEGICRFVRGEGCYKSKTIWLRKRVQR